MRKFISLLISVFLVTAMLASCTHSGTDITNSTTTLSKQTTAFEEITTKNTNNITNTENNIDGSGGGRIIVLKYRSIYYDIPKPFLDIVGNDAYTAWRSSVAYSYAEEIMSMKLFVQEFGITREQFDKANLELAKIIKYKLSWVPCINPKDYANQEDDEIYNADIIYTFDDDIIREYYLSPDYPYTFDFEFEEAVEKGEYTAQTEEWVDIEKMEAEVIAKYGNIEYETKPEMEHENVDESKADST